MKKFIYLFALVISFISCSENNSISTIEEIPEYVEVGVSFFSDKDEFYTPMTKSASNDGLYLVLLQFSEERSQYGYIEPNMSKAVAYGVFNDPSKIKFNLNTNKSYDISIDYIDAPIRELTGSNNLNNINFNKPFWNNNNKSVNINEIYYSYDTYTPFIGGDIVAVGLGATVINNIVYNYDRYFGNQRCFTPTKDVRNFNVDMKYMVSKIVVTINAEDEIDGDIYFSFVNKNTSYKANKTSGNTYELTIDKITLQTALYIYQDMLSGDENSGENVTIAIGDETDSKKYYYGDIKLMPKTVTNLKYTIKSTDISNTSLNLNYNSTSISDTLTIIL